MVAKAPEAAAEPALSDEMRAAIEAEAAKYPQRRGALLAALHLVQRERGWISPDSMRALAEVFDLEPLEVLEVVSFYNMFHGRAEGRHHVYVCTNLPCSLRGARDLLRGIERHLGIEAGETTSDGRITLGHEECLGACAWAPMLRVDETYHEGLDLAEAQRILDALE